MTTVLRRSALLTLVAVSALVTVPAEAYAQRMRINAMSPRPMPRNFLMMEQMHPVMGQTHPMIMPGSPMMVQLALPIMSRNMLAMMPAPSVKSTSMMPVKTPTTTPPGSQGSGKTTPPASTTGSTMTPMQSPLSQAIALQELLRSSPWATNPYAGLGITSPNLGGYQGVNPYSANTSNPYSAAGASSGGGAGSYGSGGASAGAGSAGGYGGAASGYGNGGATGTQRQVPTAGTDGSVLDIFGVLHEGNKVGWPLGLRILPPAAKSETLRKQVDSLLLLTSAQAVYGQVNGDAVDRAIQATAQLRDLLRNHGSDAMSEHTYREAGQFLDRLDTTLLTFKR